MEIIDLLQQRKMNRKTNDIYSKKRERRTENRGRKNTEYIIYVADSGGKLVSLECRD